MLSFRCHDVSPKCPTHAGVLALEDYNDTETYVETLTSFLRRQAPYSPYMVPLVIVHHSHRAHSPVFSTGWLVISYDKDVVVPNMEVSSRVSTRGPEEAWAQNLELTCEVAHLRGLLGDQGGDGATSLGGAGATRP
ncbi:hypothetical protein ACFE04_023334 [Oxalis oulophora]